MKHIKKIIKTWNWSRIIKNIWYLIKYDLEERDYQMKDEAIEDCIYEFHESESLIPRLKILTADETLDLLYEHPKSLSRLGDGEIKVMCGIDQPFQRFVPALAEKMKKILVHRKDNLYVGLNNAYFSSPYPYADRNYKYYRTEGTKYRRFFISFCDKENIYLDASCFCAYFRFKDDYNFEGHYNKVRRLFDGKKIALVSGAGIFNNIKYDILDNVSDKICIEAPSKNAFDQYDEIIANIERKVPKDYIVCIILGMTATVLAADLADKGYIAWDMGHIIKDYDAYKKGIAKTKDAATAFWAPD